MDSDIKVYEVSRSDPTITEITTTWAATEQDPSEGALFAPSVGADYSQRIGRQVRVLGYQVRGSVILAPDQVTEPIGVTRTRVILYQDWQTNGAQAQGEDVMAGSSVSSLLAVTGFQTTTGLHRFSILEDDTFLFQNPTYTTRASDAAVFMSGLGYQFEFEHWFDDPVLVNFGGTTASVTSILDNSFHLLAASDQSAASRELALVYTSRFYFVDC